MVVIYGDTVTKTGTQPLMDNLQSITYQTFEQDPVKYHNYEEVRVFVTVLLVLYSPYFVKAIYRALVDWPDRERMCVCCHLARRYDLIARSVICVAGAGRGPLVSRSLKAIQRAKKDAFIYAVEKNPNAFVTCVLTCVCFQSPFFM